MLSKQDLNDIKGIVMDSESRVRSEMNEMRSTFVTKDEFYKTVRILEAKMEKGFRNVWRELKFIREALNATIDHFDKENILSKKRLDKAGI